MQLVILSGKGGTGKTTVAASLAYLSNNNINIDCDVDAANLHIILKGNEIEAHEFIGAKTAKIDAAICTKCGKCAEVCRFEAIYDYKVDELRCEGCGACTVVCKYNAVALEDQVTAKTAITKTNNGLLSRADMEIGAEGSGKLITEVRKNAARYIKREDIVILDGSPGIGCAVMASLTGCDAALLVIEPTQSGLEDFMRVLAVCKFFDLKIYACINKYDINISMSNQIEQFCLTESIPIVGKIPFDDFVKLSINEAKPIVAYQDSIAAKEIKNMWKNLNIKLMEVV